MRTKKYLYIIILIAIFLLAFWFRTFPARFGELQALDPFFIYRMSEHIVNNNFQLPSTDTMILSPFNYNPWTEYIGSQYTPAILYIIINPLLKINFFEFALIYPAFMGALAVVIMFFIGKEFFSRKTGIFAAFFLAFVPAFITRTSAGFFEKEPTAGIFMLLSIYFFILSFKRKSWKFGILSGIFLMLMSTVWGGSQFIYIFYSVFVFVLLFLNRYHKNLSVSYIPVALLGILIPQLFPFHIPITSVGVLLGSAVLILLLLRVSAERFNLVTREKLPYIVPILIILSVVGFLILGMFLDVAYNILQGASELLFTRWATPIAFTVAENQPGDFRTIMTVTGTPTSSVLLPQLNSISPYLSVGILMILGLAIMLFKLFRKINPIIIFSIIWLIGAVWSIFFAVRLMFLLGPPAALASAFFLSWLIEKSYNIKIIENKKYIEKFFLGFGILFLLLILTGLNNIFYISTLLTVGIAFLIIYYMLRKPGEESLIKIFHDYITGKAERIDVIWIPVIIIIIFIISINIANAYIYSNNIGPSICFTGNLVPGEKCVTIDKNGNQIMNLNNQPWYQAMNFLARQTPEDSVVISWWDFGYWFQTRGKRKTVADGGHGDRLTLAKWFTSPVNKWKDWEPWLKDTYSVDYILMDYTLPGKYGAISAIATNSENIVGIAQFQNTGAYPQGNKTIYEFSSGPYKIWIPFGNGNVAGTPMFLYIQNEQVLSKSYISKICTNQGIMEMEEENPTMPGCVSLTNFGVFYIPEEAMNTIFSSLMFMDGYGLPVEKVFDNTLIRIYKL